VQGQYVVVFHRLGDVERVEALDAASGRPLWKADFRATYAPGVDPDTGPRCVPLIHGGAVHAYGAAGDLHCLSLAAGKKLWSRPMLRDFDGDEGYFGAGNSPIIVDGRLLVNVGGRDAAGLVALGLSDGKTLWNKTDERASYSSPTVAAIDGRPHAIFVTRLNVVCVDPRDGTVRFRFSFGQRGPTVNAATPLVFDGRLFVTANYGVGARLVRIGTGAVEPVWENDESLSSQYPTPVYCRGFLYGIHGREDVGVGQLRCVEAATGTVRWSVPDLGMAHLILACDRLLILCVEGRLLLAPASPERFQELATATVSTSVTRALPALANGRLYVRETSGRGGSLKCFELQP
jgi:outer membrane protein assembly factor BamB